mgnify:CR=1 FL=1
MAVTSIWPVKQRVAYVIDYARNPQKTKETNLDLQASMHAVDNVIEYAASELKTEERANALPPIVAAEHRQHGKRTE